MMLKSPTSLQAIPNQCPNVIGWVQVYSERKKKWSKRFLEVRNGAVCLAKNERGKEEQHLCTLTAFDFYLVTQVPAKSPKGHFFALKSRQSFPFLLLNLAQVLIREAMSFFHRGSIRLL